MPEGLKSARNGHRSNASFGASQKRQPPLFVKIRALHAASEVDAVCAFDARLETASIAHPVPAQMRRYDNHHPF